MLSHWPTPEEGLLINACESWAWKKGNLLPREVERTVYLKQVLSPLIVLFGHVLEAKIALLASSLGFQADQ